jgi:hypothetical protein
VTANYKLSFDVLRRDCGGIDGWVLVLDTKGINVWCAAGKKTFGTAELVNRIRAACLESVVSHRRLILPQLGASGVQAHTVRKETGFSVSFGPVYAKDIRAYLEAGYRATPRMRAVRFSMAERFALTAVEIAGALKPFMIYLVAVFAIAGFSRQGILFSRAWGNGWLFALMGFAAIIAGAFLTPLLLPYIPSRSFAFKGWLLATVMSVAMVRVIYAGTHRNALLTAAVFFVYPVLASYLAVNFTGATPFTNPSGVRKELRIATPLYIVSAAAGLVCFTASVLI